MSVIEYKLVEFPVVRILVDWATIWGPFVRLPSPTEPFNWFLSRAVLQVTLLVVELMTFGIYA
jgi:hypothetical protein